MRSIDDLLALVRSHRCFQHPVFEHWAQVAPQPEVIGALFHQIQKFCASTRPGGEFPAALEQLGLDSESRLMHEIVESEEDHGPELATMAGYIVNRAAGASTCPDLSDQQAVEAVLKNYSDKLLGSLPGYDPESGLTAQARRAIEVFERRFDPSRETTFKNLGTALALEIISNRHLIPGEKHCLIDSGLYGASLEDTDMHYLLEHWGEAGAEQQHERNAVEAVASVIDEETEPLVVQGMYDFLDSLTALWDVLDSALLQSGHRADTQQAVGAGA
ncbi:hypothetical protein [Engelhardtia mirabilis]|uniref:PqqC-like protein n=1 Tax=Engelhardtia mirabilis TaxID=2528011 RepID=A0A518BES6_9BACT|nr:hypothetical protein Pla133_05270 [Planctomycetes bacterium Pla133]QDU99788.1 hypothetical protein Pla86_05270 [Planctomycetes bacterium Pla86]